MTLVETKRTIVPTREGYERWAEVYDSDGNPLVALEERHQFTAFLGQNGGSIPKLISQLGVLTNNYKHTSG